ncbi:hydroxypyruvate isomerase family protein [Salibaculum griseiflavum]|uniref:Hydroxypyruvate isomerase n=1 Tax=Salibaculum griseiflavum TaxID=1914409 RepID=A0A2V1PA60_9RHOB|nr:TIM barrel protein [Salibaculum griseiflavum]PWG18648.1 hydroxypyruvate isomerase [Salibaculum griseiflavum]
MPRFCANLTTLFTEAPLLDRPALAAEAGFEAVEILFPYDVDAKALGRALSQSGLPLALINCPPPNYADPDGPRGFAAVPEQQERFRKAFQRSLRYMDVLGAERLHVMAGLAEGPEAAAVFADNLAWAADTAEGRQLTIEPINPHDMPGYFLDDFSVALALLDEVGAPNLGLQFDAYHAHRITGDVMNTWAMHGHRTAHVQVAGHPGRHEPMGGAIDYSGFFARLDKDGYQGWVSGEYNPRTRTEDGLGWIT